LLLLLYSTARGIITKVCFKLHQQQVKAKIQLTATAGLKPVIFGTLSKGPKAILMSVKNAIDSQPCGLKNAIDQQSTLRINSFPTSNEHTLVARILFYTFVFTIANSFTHLFQQQLAREATGNLTSCHTF
jgi:hypothetical protein